MSPARKKPATAATKPAKSAAATRAARSAEATEICPWCSAKVVANAAKCPSCGASLRDAVDGEILGVTQIDPAAVSRAARAKPGRLATWLGAENTAEGDDLGGHVEPPSKEVREEMLRLELAAIDAEIEAKKQAAEAQKLLPEDAEAEPS